MSLRIQRRWLLFVVLALVAGLGFTSTPAHADDPIPTTIGILFFGSGDHAGQTITADAYVRPADNGSAYPSGSVVFSVGDGQPVPLDPHYLNADTTFTIPQNTPFPVTATFTGTNGWGDSTVTVIYKPLQNIVWDPEPTILRLGPNAALTLTLATHVLNSIGGPMPGRIVSFSLFGPAPFVTVPPYPGIKVCTAVSDAHGLATCGGKGLAASIVSILAGGAYATETPTGAFEGYNYVKLPVILFK